MNDCKCLLHSTLYSIQNLYAVFKAIFKAQLRLIHQLLSWIRNKTRKMADFIFC